MEQVKHRIKVFTSPELVTKAKNMHRVRVFWEVDFEESLLGFLTSKVGGHDSEDLKRGLGELTVEVPFEKFKEMTNIMAYAELVSLVYLVEKRGLNVFGVYRGPLVQKIQLELAPSQDLSIYLLERDPEFTKALAKTPEASMLGITDFGAAFFVGSDVVKGDDAWIEEYRNAGLKPEYFHAVKASDVKRMLEIRTPFGILHMSHRTVLEYLNMPLHREQVAEKGQRFTRPFESAVERVRQADMLVEPENKHLIKLKKKLGDKAASIFCEMPPTFVDLKLMDGVSEPNYMVIGYRALYSTEVQERLERGGYTYVKVLT
ncbi:hypothetical protein ACP3V3_02025 [Vibrio sp. PNB22_3_1]